MTNTDLPAERHIQSLNNNGAHIKASDGTTAPVTLDFYRKAVEQCVRGGYNAVTAERTEETGWERPAFFLCPL